MLSALTALEQERQRILNRLWRYYYERNVEKAHGKRSPALSIHQVLAAEYLRGIEDNP